jgi:probable F420-dependent oxidoreductase
VDLGIVTPVVNLNPRFDPPAWELDGGIDDIVEVSRAAERVGFRWVSCPEHVVIPTSTAATRGGRYWDPLVTLSFVAAATRTIGLLTHVLVLGYHHPLEVVKRYGTLDVASRGRVILGVGVGSLEAEFELLGAPFEGRGARADDALRAIRSSFSEPVPSYAGTHFEYSGFVVEPSGLQSHVPIWVGGRSRRSLRRALELGDGWIPFGLSFEELRAMLGADDVVETLEARATPLEVVLAPEPPLDPAGDPDGTAATMRGYGDIGATGLSLRFVHRSRAHYVEQLEAMMAVAAGVEGP